MEVLRVPLYNPPLRIAYGQYAKIRKLLRICAKLRTKYAYIRSPYESHYCICVHVRDDHACSSLYTTALELLVNLIDWCDFSYFQHHNVNMKYLK